MHETPYGYCRCGCGQKTSLALQNDTGRGYVRGQPMRFLPGHNARPPGPTYAEQDRGYTTPCWIWQRALNNKGYGQAWDGKKLVLAHRMFFQRVMGEIPKGTELDHLCSQPACVNPAHLEAVTHAENLHRGRGAKLSIAKAQEIRARVAAGETQISLAREFGVERQAIRSVVHGRRWRAQ